MIDLDVITNGERLKAYPAESWLRVSHTCRGYGYEGPSVASNTVLQPNSVETQFKYSVAVASDVPKPQWISDVSGHRCKTSVFVRWDETIRTEGYLVNSLAMTESWWREP